MKIFSYDEEKQIVLKVNEEEIDQFSDQLLFWTTGLDLWVSLEELKTFLKKDDIL